MNLLKTTRTTFA